MKYLRVFTILFCLTLSMTILSACGNKEPSANSNPSSASGGGTQSENAQNSDAPEEDAPSIELADMAGASTTQPISSTLTEHWR